MPENNRASGRASRVKTTSHTFIFCPGIKFSTIRLNEELCFAVIFQFAAARSWKADQREKKFSLVAAPYADTTPGFLALPRHASGCRREPGIEWFHPLLGGAQGMRYNCNSTDSLTRHRPMDETSRQNDPRAQRGVVDHPGDLAILSPASLDQLYRVYRRTHCGVHTRRSFGEKKKNRKNERQSPGGDAPPGRRGRRFIKGSWISRG